MPGPWDDWEAFHRQWPGHDGVAWVSRVGFSQFDQQAFLHALIVTDQRLACQDNAGKSTVSTGLQVLLERSEGGGWEVRDWSVEGSPVRVQDSFNPFTREQALKVLPGFREGDGEMTIPLLSEAEAILGYADIEGERVTATTIGLRLRDRLYEYADLILTSSNCGKTLACLYDDLHLDLGMTPPELDSILQFTNLFPNRLDLEHDSDIAGYRRSLRGFKPDGPTLAPNQQQQRND